MPHGKRSKKRSKRNRTLPEQLQLQKTEKQHEDAGSHLAYSESNVTDVPVATVVSIPLDVPVDTVVSIPLDGPPTSLLNNLLKKIIANCSETRKELHLDNNSRKVQRRDTKQSSKKDAQQINEKAATQVDDERLLNIIESAEPHQAVQLLEGNNHFSQDGLDIAFISACRHGLKYLVQTLVRLGANVQFKDTQGNTPLLICAENGFIYIVHFLLKEKADVNAFNSAGDTALILSIRAAGSLEMVRVLLEQEGIDISHQNQDGYTALMKAVEVRDVDVMKILMEKYSKDERSGTYRTAGKPRCLKLIDAVNLKGMTAEQIADNCGLGDIYHILKTHTRNRESPLVLAVKGHDLKSLQVLLGCHFVQKRAIQNAFMTILEICELKEATIVTEKAVLIIKRLLECGAEVDTSFYFGSSPLSVAVTMGDYDLVEILCQSLDQSAQLWSQHGSRAMVAAATSGRCDLINLLLKHNADIDTKYTYSGSPLDCALKHGHHHCAKLLIQHGAEMDIESALRSAVTHQLPEYMKFVFENYRPEVKNFATKELTELNKFLVSAAKGGNLEIIGHLLDAGADVNQENVRGETPLGQSKDGDVAKFLISRGANVNLRLCNRDSRLQQNVDVDYFSRSFDENERYFNEKRSNGRTPIMEAACREESVSVLQILLDHGADINAQDDEGNTALMEAVCRGYHINVTFLLEFHKEKKLSLNVRNHEGKTALMFAVTDSNPEIVKQLINFATDVNVKDVKGNTALLHAATKRKGPGTEILETLINAGSDVNSQNYDGFSPLMMATLSRLNDAIIILLDSGADVNAVSEQDHTKTAVSFLTGWRCHSTDYKLCFQTFLKKGTHFSYMEPGIVHQMIRKSKIEYIPELIQGGVGPADVKSEYARLDIVVCNAIPTVSPLCLALLVGNVSLARYFVGNMFLTHSDITSLTGNKILRAVLEKKQLTFLDELSSQPWSLLQLAFVSVSSAVGSSPGRETRVSMLPLPQVMKDKLLFRLQEVQLDSSTQDVDYLQLDQTINNYDLFQVDYMDNADDTESDDYYIDNDNCIDYEYDT